MGMAILTLNTVLYSSFPPNFQQMILHLKLNFSICYNTRITHGLSSVSKDSMELCWCFEYALVH
jgi:hypothetical protein